jgi:hypothetical protein
LFSHALEHLGQYGFVDEPFHVIEDPQLLHAIVW